MKQERYRKFTCFVAGLIMASSILLGVASTLHAAVLFTDNFNDGNDNGWTQLNRCWHVSDGRYYLDGGYGCGVPSTGTRDGFSYTHVSDPTWTDYIFNFTFDTTNPPSAFNPDWGNTAAENEAQVFFRVQGPLPSPSLGAPTQYRANFFSPSPTGAPGEEQFELIKYVNGNSTQVAFLKSSGLILLGTNVGKIIVVGGHIQIFVNNHLVLDFTDPDPIPFGGIGLGAIWEVNAWFDNVRVETRFPTSNDECKNGGWIHFGYKNQGECIKFVNTGKRDHEDHERGH